MTPRRRRGVKPENPSTATPSGPPDPGAEPAGDGGWLTVGVVSIGGASLLSDSSHEMVTSLLPTFLTTTLGAGRSLTSFQSRFMAWRSSLVS